MFKYVESTWDKLISLCLINEISALLLNSMYSLYFDNRNDLVGTHSGCTVTVYKSCLLALTLSSIPSQGYQ